MAIAEAAVVAEVLLDVIALVKAGVELNEIAHQAQVMQDAGATDAEVAAYIKSLRDDALKAL